jgi:molybdopterin-containing oxidoreductase family iron-sulfur binding subunit
MSDEAKRYWMSLPLRDAAPPAPGDEFPEPVEAGNVHRRAFLKAAGFAFAGAALAGCQRTAVQHAIPHLTQPEESVAGRSLQYASTCQACSANCGLLVKTRDGRPIKLEGNPDHPLSHGGLCAVGQASILGLYDRLRLQHPLKNRQRAEWDEVDRDIKNQLEDLQRRGGAVRIVSGTITSPTTRSLIERFLSRFTDGKHIVYDPISCAAIPDAHERTHGVRVLPHYHFERAHTIVSFDADFLGTWIAPVEFSHGYRSGRNLEGPVPQLSYHAQLEARLSLTGSKADRRVRLAPEETGLTMTHLAARLAKRAGAVFNAASLEAAPLPAAVLSELEERLWATRRKSLVLSGSENVSLQVLCNFINHMLGNYGNTIDIARPSSQRQGSDVALAALLQEFGELPADRPAALLLLDCNPAFDVPESVTALRRASLLVSCTERADESAELAQYVCPHPHYLAAWSDAEPVNGMVSLSQPTMQPLGNTRPVLESLAAWAGSPQPAYALLREHWERRIFRRQTRHASFQAFWDQTVHDGQAAVSAAPVGARAFDVSVVRPVLRADRPAQGSFALVLYPKVGMPDGKHAYNPWLHELPDPISKVTWDNYACLAPSTAAQLQVGDGDVVRVEAVGEAGAVPYLELPALIQPGQDDRVVAVALGYGSKLSERFADIGPRWIQAGPTVGENGLVGTNAAPLLTWQDGHLRYTGSEVRLSKTGKRHPLASTQTHHTITVPDRVAPPGQQRRPLIHEQILTGFLAAPKPREPQAQADLWPEDHAGERGPRCGMVVDLQTCTGCSACVVACQVENNIPVVGKDEVLRQREMHWLRIDRYYSGTGDDVDVAHQPMMCQHCGNAPCETVCPVLATVHSSEGLNQQVYNRCVGTRYCANNCPYKVRRFNWFAYSRNDTLQNLVLNPDVTVRSRGVMEKCSFCVQRIQEAKAEARSRGETLRDGAIQTACQQSCPAQAIVFGDLNDPNSKVSQMLKDRRRYQLLTELNVKPSVHYLGLVRNRVDPQMDTDERR